MLSLILIMRNYKCMDSKCTYRFKLKFIVQSSENIIKNFINNSLYILKSIFIIFYTCTFCKKIRKIKFNYI